MQTRVTATAASPFLTVRVGALLFFCMIFFSASNAVAKQPLDQLIELFSIDKAAAGEKCNLVAAPYRKARKKYWGQLRSYWKKVERKRALRKRKKRKSLALTAKDYILTHPPAYKGPAKPDCLKKIEAAKRKTKKKKKRRSTLPVVADFLKAAKRHYGFVPRKTDERSFQRNYAREGLSIGLTADQILGVYALETGGIGPYYRQSGIFPLDKHCRPIKPKGRAASTALGYAQLLAANSAIITKEKGAAIAKQLEFKALLSSDDVKKSLLKKAKLLRKMAADVRRGVRRYKSRNNWREFVAFSKTSKGRAIHALNLDADIGPRLQVHKLKKIVDVATRKGMTKISGAQLELMNLVGYGRGLEMMTPIARDVPTTNFFSRQGYERNPVAKNLTSDGLLKKIARIIDKRLKACGSIQFAKIFSEVKQAANQ